MHKLSRGERKVLHVYRKCMIMYGISQIHRVHSRLTTGLGGLKPIWILVPVAVRFPGCYKIGQGFEEFYVLQKMYDHVWDFTGTQTV